MWQPLKIFLRPLVRIIVGLLALPLFRMFLKRVIRLQELDAELEKDLEQWFRASLLLLVATYNMEQILFDPFFELLGDPGWFGDERGDMILLGFRLLLAIGVVETMPDQELFSIIHPGPPKLEFGRKNGYWREFKAKFRPLVKGIVCQHLQRSSPVFAILAAIPPPVVETSSLGQTALVEQTWIGWTCYLIAITQYLIIGLVTSVDKVADVLSEFDKQVQVRRRELIDEFSIEESAEARTAPCDPQSQSAPVQNVDDSSG